jgi:hypothetical protein
MSSAKERFAWLDRAACRPYPDWDENATWRVQLKVCEGCPVRQPCLNSALELGTGGVRGGTTPTQRARLTGRPRWNGGGPGALDPWVRMVDGRPHPVDRYALAGARRRILEHGTDLAWEQPKPAGARR